MTQKHLHNGALPPAMLIDMDDTIITLIVTDPQTNHGQSQV